MTNVILKGTVGSTAYGLDREGSDIDTLGIFVAPSEDFWGLSVPNPTVVTTDPDVTMHEVGKYMSLGLKCNPTILELMWLPSELISELSIDGASLRSMKRGFLSTPYVRNAYGGYAMQQIKRLQNRNAEGKEGFSSDLKKRTAKHARHCFRLLHQGRELLETGDMTVRVPDPHLYWRFDDMTVDDIVREFNIEDEHFRAAQSVLPEKPATAQMVNLLLEIRSRNLSDYYRKR